MDNPTPKQEEATTIDDQLLIVKDGEPDPIYNLQESAKNQAGNWQVGDLVRQSGKLILIIAVGRQRQHQAPDATGDLILVRTYRELICLNPTGVVWQADGPTERVDFLHNTGLRYEYRNREQVEQDFRNGLFTPYFEIL